MPTINLTDDEHAAVTAAIGRLVDEDRSPHAPRLDPLRSALAKLDPKAAPGTVRNDRRSENSEPSAQNSNKGNETNTRARKSPKPTPPPKAPAPARGGKQARS